MPWYVFAVAAAVLWGIEYALSERILSRAPAITLFFWLSLFQLLGCIVSLTFKGNTIDPRPILDSHPYLFIAAAITGLFAGLAIQLSIKSGDNAATASMVEISYPFFVILFTWLFFGENKMNWLTLIGGAICFVGTTIVISSQK